MGPWVTDAGALLRERRRLDADDLAVFMNITPEFASAVGNRTLGQVARSVVVSSIPDAILISGPMAGAEPDLDLLKEAKEAVGDDAPVLVNTGTKATNIASFLTVADGAIVGSDLKYDGYTWNALDPERVAKFMEAARG
jgi:membrane complex biogenesis BtpA family protein